MEKCVELNSRQPLLLKQDQLALPERYKSLAERYKSLAAFPS